MAYNMYYNVSRTFHKQQAIGIGVEPQYKVRNSEQNGTQEATLMHAGGQTSDWVRRLS